MPRPIHRLRPTAALSAAVVAALVLAACGGSDGQSGAAKAGPKPLSPSTSGLPAKLAANVKQGDQLVGEGVGDLQARLAELKRYPVVVNQWASWCEPCRLEIPFFRSMTAKYRKRVAFVGIDLQDDRDAAQDFMRELPSGFPSIFDPDGSVTASIGGGRASPTTFYFDKNGKQRFTKIGAYATAELLEQDIQRYALGGGS